MADLNYTVGVSIAAAQANLSKLQNQVKGTTDVFNKFKTAIGGLAVGSFVASALKGADAMVDLSNATGIATKNIMGFTRAAQLNGGSLEGAANSVLKFTQNIGSAADGSAELQNAFYEVGVSLEDLGKLSEQDLLGRVVEGLSQVEDGSQRVRLQAQLLGKSFAAVDVRGLSNDLAEQTRKSAEAAAASEKVGAALDQIDKVLTKLRDRVVVALGPLVEYLGNLDVDKLDNAIDGLIKLATALIALKGATEALKLLAGIMGVAAGGALALRNGLGTVAAVAVPAAAGIAGLASRFSAFGSGVIGSAAAISGKLLGVVALIGGLKIAFESLTEGKIDSDITTLAGVFGLLGTKVGIVTGIVYGLNEAMTKLSGIDPIGFLAEKLEQTVKDNFPKAHAAIEGLGRALGMADISAREAMTSVGGFANAAKALAQDDAEQVAAFADAIKANAEASAKKLEIDRKVTSEAQKLSAEMKGVVSQYQEAYATTQRRYEIETQLVGASLQQRELVTKSNELEVGYQEKILALREQYVKILESGNKLQQDTQLPIIAKAMGDITLAYQQQIGAVDGLVTARMKALEQEKLTIFASESQLELQKQIRDVMDEMATSTMTEIEKKSYSITRAAEERAIQEIRAEEVRRGSLLTDAEKQKYLDAALAGTEELIGLNRDLYNQSRTFSSGWSKAFRAYADEATNAAKFAENIFNKSTQGMEDLLVNFVKTGKFEWKDFLDTMKEELLRAGIRAAFASLIGGLTSDMGGLSGALGGLFSGFGGGGKGGVGGMAGAGMNLLGLGGTALKLFGGAGAAGQGGAYEGAGLDDLLSDMGFGPGDYNQGAESFSISDDWGQMTESFWSAGDDWFSGFDSGSSSGGGGFDFGGIFDDFDGFFANGGTLGAGKWGIAGEKGPELITGPANITPMVKNGSSGDSYVTYNINAVDALSFKQLVASDPSFIHSVAMQGARGVPSRR